MKTITKTHLCLIISLLLLWGQSAFGQAPANDQCANAIDLTCGGTQNGTTFGATPSSYSNSSPDVWYRISNVSGPVTVSLCGTTPTWDSYIRVYKPGPFNPACGTTMPLVVQDDDYCFPLSRVTWNATAGDVYYICVSGVGAANPPNWPTVGNFQISTQCTPAAPSNDACANAVSLYCGNTVSGSTVGAAPDMGFSAPGVWYSVPGNGGTMVASLCGPSNYDNAIVVVQGSCQNTAILVSDDNSCGGTSATVSWASTAGITYYILVNGAGTASGNFELNISCPMPQTPPNDFCNNATLVDCGTSIHGTTIGATGPYNSSPDVWYTFTGTGTNVTASLCGSNNYDSYMHVTRLAPGSVTCVDPQWGAGSNDNACGLDAEVTFLAELGVTYLIRVTGATIPDVGNFTLTITCDTDCVPSNDECKNAIPVVCGGDYTGNTRCATADLETGMPYPNGTRGVWYTLQGTGGTFTAQTCGGASWDTYLYVYSGDCNEFLGLTLEALNDDYCGLQSLVTFATVPGVTYYIVVGGYHNATGLYNLKVTGSDCEEKPKKTDETQYTGAAKAFQLVPAPNPSTTYVDFNISVVKPGSGNLRILDLAGHLVAEQDLGVMEEGLHTVRHEWQGVPAGIYLYEMRVGESQLNGKLQVLR